jgi:iron complex outermembrane receptor protein
MKRTKLITLVLSSASTLAFPLVAFAQQAVPAPTDVEAIVVTGSRLISNGNDMPTPVTVVSAQDLTNLKPTSVLDAINVLPVFSGSRTQAFTGTPTGGTGGGAAASNQLSLRNLGPLRTLVLFDGQRVAPTSLTNVVDADIIPQMLIQRVDVVTGGASAVYGSDAMVGVVNFIPDKNFNGLKIQGQGGESRYSDNKNWKAGIAAGTSLLDGRLHIEGSLEHYDNAGIPSRFDRPWYNVPVLVGAGTQASPLNLLTNTRSNQNTFGGLITNGVLTGQQFATNSVLSPFVHGTATSTNTVEIGGDGSYNDSSLVAKLRWTQFYGRADFDFSDNVHGHVQGSLKHMFNRQSVTYFANNNLTFSSTNAFLPAAYRTQLAAANQTTFRMSELVTQVPPWGADVYSDQTVLNAGLDGDFHGYKWNLGLNYGETDLTDYITNDQNNQHLSAALDAVINPANGQTVCSVTLTNPGLNPGCVPLNLFGPTAASREALAYVYQQIRWDGKTRMYDANFSVSGEPFSTWAGPVGIALSAEWRRTTFSSTTNDPSTAVADCTGLRFNCASGLLLWQNAFGVRSEVGMSVLEGAAEFDAPLLKDAPLAKSVSVNGAIRVMDYSTTGRFLAWKLGGVWEVNDEVRFRGTISRDIRAPTLYDLFAPATVVPVISQDLLTGLTPTVSQYREGNPELTAEIGKTKTVGVVYRPAWLPGASLSLDAFDITVNKAVIEVRGVGASAQLACYASGGASPYCQLQQRPLGFTNTSAANVVTAWGQKNINIASLRTYGVDIEGNYVGDIAGHRFALRTYVTWQPHIVNKTPGLADVELAGVAQAANPNIASPSLRVAATQSINITDKFRADVTERARGSLRLNGDSGLYDTGYRVPKTIYLDLNLSYALNDMNIAGRKLGASEVFLNISNLLDKDPPPRSDLGFDDVIGRAFVGGFRIRF